ncbi:hypothetical protein BDQ17DRAFT_1372240, partial [Cyathus striatus]
MGFEGASNFDINVARDFIQQENNYHENSSKAMDIITRAACPGAGHDSAERAVSQKLSLPHNEFRDICHPDTRKIVIEEIMKWINTPDPENQIMWLNGAAGVGKSAIAQTIAKDSRNTLISSFFFSRTFT